jgi:hypothetical protein
MREACVAAGGQRREPYQQLGAVCGGLVGSVLIQNAPTKILYVYLLSGEQINIHSLTCVINEYVYEPVVRFHVFLYNQCTDTLATSCNKLDSSGAIHATSSLAWRMNVGYADLCL